MMWDQLLRDFCFVLLGFIVGGYVGIVLSWREVRKSGYVSMSLLPWKAFRKKVEVGQ